jgi:hypothetical protein
MQQCCATPSRRVRTADAARRQGAPEPEPEPEPEPVPEPEPEPELGLPGSLLPGSEPEPGPELALVPTAELANLLFNRVHTSAGMPLGERPDMWQTADGPSRVNLRATAPQRWPEPAGGQVTVSTHHMLQERARNLWHSQPPRATAEQSKVLRLYPGAALSSSKNSTLPTSARTALRLDDDDQQNRRLVCLAVTNHVHTGPYSC